MSDDWVSVDEAARRVRRSKRRVYEWIATGGVKTLRPGRVMWVYLPDILKLEAQQRPGRPKTRRGGLQ